MLCPSLSLHDGLKILFYPPPLRFALALETSVFYPPVIENEKNHKSNRSCALFLTRISAWVVNAFHHLS